MKNVAQTIATQGFLASVDFRKMFHEPTRSCYYTSPTHGFDANSDPYCMNLLHIGALQRGNLILATNPAPALLAHASGNAGFRTLYK
ncbi:hypothetical protein BCEN4_1780015 [Burkholderia cenocepacia]|nr:hypothetical protein BCEN4_1780015 [Burkholderia cenocepacia]